MELKDEDVAASWDAFVDSVPMIVTVLLLPFVTQTHYLTQGEDTMEATTLQGGCLCGAMRYQVASVGLR